MYNRLNSFLKKHDILNHSQYGFREGCSIVHALIDIITKIQQNIDRGFYSCGVFIDLKKTFDTVDHFILLGNLEHYGVRGIMKDWFSSYLMNRYQSTQINCCISEKERVPCGVPQTISSPICSCIFSIFKKVMNWKSVLPIMLRR